MFVSIACLCKLTNRYYLLLVVIKLCLFLLLAYETKEVTKVNLIKFVCASRVFATVCDSCVLSFVVAGLCASFP